MVKPKHIVIAGLVLAAAIVAYFIFSQSEAEKIKKQFTFIAEKLEKSDKENPLIAAANANKIQEVFTEPFTIHAPAYDVSREVSTDEISPIVLSTRTQYAQMTLKFYDYSIDFPAKDTANVSVTEVLRGKLTSGEYVEDINELSCKINKVDGVWLITEIEVVEVLEK